jgi:ankyrin repeat protein
MPLANYRIEAAKHLIQAGANVKIKDSYGYDALIMATEMGNDGVELMDLLLDKGADIILKT